MVRIEVVNNRLRLRWSHGGKRYCLSLGLANTTTNYKVAQGKATQIELDIVSGNFDATLSKYKTTDARKQVTPLELYGQYADYKMARVHPNTHAHYVQTGRTLKRYLLHTRGKELDPNAFLLWYRDNVDDINTQTKLQRVSYLRSAWAWGLARGLVPSNPWLSADKGVLKTAPKQPPKPLTTEEVEAIARTIDPHYLPFFRFCIGTGCRIGEAAGLRWSSVAEDFSSVWIGECYVKGEQRPVKCNRPRTLSLSLSVQTLLRERYIDGVDGYVFLAKRGRPILTDNYRRQVWYPTLKALNIPRRTPYVTRSTFISHALSRGLPPVVVAQYTGHSLEVLYKHYAGDIKAHTVPDILEFLE